jgi:hypothetical protein
MSLTVVCVKCRPLYTYTDVNRLYKMVEKNLRGKHKFVCFTDDAEGLKCQSKTLPAGVNGWWAKLSLFRSGILQGKVLYIDLDSIILDSLDFVMDYKGHFGILRDFLYPHGMYNSSVMIWDREFPHIWENWLKAGKPSREWGDQAWIREQMPAADLLQDYFPGKFLSWKADCIKSIPDGAVLVTFHGKPKLRDFPDDHIVSRTWRGKEVLAA